MKRWVLTSKDPPGTQLGTAAGETVYMLESHSDLVSALSRRVRRKRDENDQRAIEIRDAENGYEVAEIHPHKKHIVVDVSGVVTFPEYQIDDGTHGGRRSGVVGCEDDAAQADALAGLALEQGMHVFIVDRDTRKAMWPASGEPATAESHLRKPASPRE